MTKLLYLQDTYQYESPATVVEVFMHDGRQVVILDQTIFYPQGGGQPTDKGLIVSDSAKFQVTDVRLSPDSKVYHFGEFVEGGFQPNDTVQLKIDSDLRMLHAKLHSAGHLIDCAMTQIHYANLKPSKGFHYPEGTYVEYEGQLEDPEKFRQDLEKHLAELIQQDLTLTSHSLSPAQAKAQGVWAPEGKEARVTQVHGFEAWGCGGTHVRSTQELGQIKITKIKNKKGNLRISYSL